VGRRLRATPTAATACLVEEVGVLENARADRVSELAGHTGLGLDILLESWKDAIEINTPFLTSRDDAETYACMGMRGSRLGDLTFAADTLRYLVCHPRKFQSPSASPAIAL
jgi:hypothetical protein